MLSCNVGRAHLLPRLPIAVISWSSNVLPTAPSTRFRSPRSEAEALCVQLRLFNHDHVVPRLTTVTHHSPRSCQYERTPAGRVCVTEAEKKPRRGRHLHRRHRREALRESGRAEVYPSVSLTVCARPRKSAFLALPPCTDERRSVQSCKTAATNLETLSSTQSTT